MHKLFRAISKERHHTLSHTLLQSREHTFIGLLLWWLEVGLRELGFGFVNIE